MIVELTRLHTRLVIGTFRSMIVELTHLHADLVIGTFQAL